VVISHQILVDSCIASQNGITLILLFHVSYAFILGLKVGSHDGNLCISLVQNFVPGYGAFYRKKAPPNNQHFC
jgi:hypothetical protein